MELDPATTSFLGLFLHASLDVQIVMGLLWLASVWSWVVIISFGFRLSSARKAIERFDTEYREADDIDEFHRRSAGRDQAIARVFSAGVTEWRRSTSGKNIDREGTRERLATTMGATIAQETDRLAARLGILATIAAASPFVGLFGTVLGIMHSFIGIAAAQNTSLAVVAPGIAEALFATAIGLFAAIPALMAYNKLQAEVAKAQNRLEAFADEFSAILSRQIDERLAA